jgi:hypothetical protein
VRVELARAHVPDHALAQRADGIGTHGSPSAIRLSANKNTSIWIFGSVDCILAESGLRACR